MRASCTAASGAAATRAASGVAANRCTRGPLASMLLSAVIGVGRAVNQAVVIAFAGIWMFNFAFTTLMLGLNPDMQVYR
ncbi:MAG: phospholipid/cholesterol/gamma-HCH transport system permease protein [Pseudonocardiales bacterium]|nr:phospholipid/cholesterol/gamma-HCH transport system permease protein [Pseudonocardiales bacterium]